MSREKAITKKAGSVEAKFRAANLTVEERNTILVGIAVALEEEYPGTLDTLVMMALERRAEK